MLYLIGSTMLYTIHDPIHQNNAAAQYSGIFNRKEGVRNLPSAMTVPIHLFGEAQPHLANILIH
jgi:hypothetical protein